MSKRGTKERICLTCGKTFRYCDSGRLKYCSEECMLAAAYDRRAVYYKELWEELTEDHEKHEKHLEAQRKRYERKMRAAGKTVKPRGRQHNPAWKCREEQDEVKAAVEEYAEKPIENLDERLARLKREGKDYATEQKRETIEKYARIKH